MNRFEKIFASLGLVLSLVALGATVYDGYENRRYMRLTQAERLYFDFSHLGDDFRLTIGNDGNGPAVIKTFSAFYRDDGKIVSVDHWDQLVGLVGADASAGYTFSVPAPGDYLKREVDSQDLFACSGTGCAGKFLPEIPHIQLVGCVCDLYENCRIVTLHEDDVWPDWSCGDLTPMRLPPSFSEKARHADQS